MEQMPHHRRLVLGWQGMQSSQTRTWRLIWLIAISALICWLVSVMMLRALAQTVETNEAESAERRTPPPKLSDEESPEFRDSADNNISLPVDI
jgi:flagellar biosynthesis/type III secretory pathway M-ring protein FliF/YscJ